MCCLVDVESYQASCVLVVNVNKVHHSFADTKKAEMMMEGKAFHTAKLLVDTEGTEDKMTAAPVNGVGVTQSLSDC